MEAKELMIGDWIEFTSKYGYGKGQIARIEPREGSVEPTTFTIIKTDEQGNTLLYVGVSKVCVRPIPLTAEILEKNGFFSKEAGHYYNYELLYGKSCNERISIRHQNHLIACSTPENRNEFALFGIIVLKYVHELQHALKLCGIDKQITI